MKNLRENLVAFHKDENGDIAQTGIIIAIFAVLALGGMKVLAPKIKAMFTKAEGALDDANGVNY
ncbi:Flp family type IVb pilin [Wukongibacter baidiensis]